MNQSPIKVLIVDDEPFAREYIREMLRHDEEITIVGEAGNGKAALRAIQAHRPDLVFLDIQMPEMDGFVMLQNLNRVQMPHIVFTTAFEEYAIRAFEFHALDYLLKPFDQKRFGAAIAHAKKTLRDPHTMDDQSLQIRELLNAVAHKPNYPERLLVKQDGRIVFVKFAEVDWIKADDKYLHLHCAKSRFTVRQTLHGLKAQLDPARFVQLNRSVIVNVESIKELHTMFNGEHEVQLHDGAKFALSPGHKRELFDVLGKPVG
ncbi:MAG: response regulator [Pyrinomonadaceae bacterium]